MCCRLRELSRAACRARSDAEFAARIGIVLEEAAESRRRAFNLKCAVNLNSEI
jgi:hypothetical protein